MWWCAEDGVSWRYAPWTVPLFEHHITSTDRAENPWYGLLSDAAAASGFTLEPEIFPAATDSRFIRQLGIPAIGFSPMAGTPILLHDHNEYLGRRAFAQGCAAYVRVVRAMAAAGPEVDAAVAAAKAAKEAKAAAAQQQMTQAKAGGVVRKARPPAANGGGSADEERPSKQAKAS